MEYETEKSITSPEDFNAVKTVNRTKFIEKLHDFIEKLSRYEPVVQEEHRSDPLTAFAKQILRKEYDTMILPEIQEKVLALLNEAAQITNDSWKEAHNTKANENWEVAKADIRLTIFERLCNLGRICPDVTRIHL
eukprot:GHVP01033183.1.p1 GENE.GHVP01033183.1~~GHVP01033183.1.p1  ORF type:complete len:135 (-),score=11.98 GHVP01033183.1:87-491(-)